MSQQTVRDIIYVATAEELLSRSYYCRLWMAARNISISIPRRSWLDAIADAIRDYKGLICHTNGKPYQVPCIDTVFGDTSMRWLSYFLLPDDTGRLPKMKTRKVERLRLIDLFFKIRHPDIARHFGR